MEPTSEADETKIPISISISLKLLRDIDARARSMNLNRSQYFAALASDDLREKGGLTLRPEEPKEGPKKPKKK